MLHLQHLGGCSDSAITAFERANSLILPIDCREFLMRYNGGRLWHAVCLVPVLNKPVPVDNLYCLVEPENGPCRKIARHQESFKDFLADYEFPVASKGCGNDFFLNCSKEFGGVYYFDYRGEHKMSNAYATRYLIAYTFSEFLHGFRDFDFDFYALPRPLQWPLPIKNKIRFDAILRRPFNWEPRQPVIWAPGDEPKYDLNELRPVLQNSKPFVSMAN